LNNPYNENDQQAMLEIAVASIHSGLLSGHASRLDLSHYSEKLIEHRATFITLEISHRLRGCIGSLVAHRPLAEDISVNAFSAAFRDPRFNKLSNSEYDLLEIHISILSPPEKMLFDSEQSLLDQIKPGVDGLIISDQEYRGTFLPSVWDSLPNKADFFSELKQKAGLSKHYWSNTIQVERYSTFSFGKTIAEVIN